MTQQVQELIDKIKSEGVQAAEQKASEIEQQAQKSAEAIIEEAKQERDKIIEKAKEESKKTLDSTHMALQQASRDMILNLRKEIEHVLMMLISKEVRTVLSSDHLADILSSTIKGTLDKKSESDDIKVMLSDEDLKKLKSGFISKLKDQLKHHPIDFQSAHDIGKGFSISFDSGKSAFDFTDESLVEFLGAYLNTELADLLKESTQSKK